jgi:hypothetical protein
VDRANFADVCGDSFAPQPAIQSIATAIRVTGIRDMISPDRLLNEREMPRQKNYPARGYAAQPRVARQSGQPWVLMEKAYNPEGVAQRVTTLRNPFRVRVLDGIFPRVALLRRATLGCAAKRFQRKKILPSARLRCQF